MTFPNFFKSPTILYAATGAVLLYASLPPLNLWPLAWIAPVPWIMLIRQKELAGPRPYLALWLVGFCYWLAMLHWIRLPFWALHFGWVALAGYFAFYVPVFIGLSRIAVHRLRWPVMLVAPIVWTGLELARAHLLTGMSMADLAHSQYRQTLVIQIADLAGQLSVCFVIVFAAACIARMLRCEESPRVFWPIAPAVVLLGIVLGYGYWRSANVVTRPGPRVALIQGSIDMQFGEESADALREKFYREYFQLSEQAVAKFGQVDLIVWPEIFYRTPIITYDPDAGDRDPNGIEHPVTGADFRRSLRAYADETTRGFADTTAQLGTPILLGLDSQHYTADGVKIYNSAAYLAKSGKLLGRYDKIHLVMFGEYIPFTDSIPWLAQLTPISGGMTPGKKPLAMELEFTPSSASPRRAPTEGWSAGTTEWSGTGVGADRSVIPANERATPTTIRFAPNICYETVLSRVIRREVNVLQTENREPDVLINLSNDGWYWNSSELEQLFACSVFRAVECRKPYLIAANTGISGMIDAGGHILLEAPRHAPATLVAEVPLDSRRSFYLRYGDWPAGLCLACCVFFAGVGMWDRFRRRRAS
jgi:apolipoprotein N-acyltransferase